MILMNQFMAKVPFDLYELQLFNLVATLESFTNAGRKVGLTQSAITRQIKGIENRLGTPLFERTTRRVQLTPAGKFLLQKSQNILRDVTQSINALQQSFNLLPPTLRIGVSRSIGLAYLPGFFVNFHRKFPQVQTQLVQQTSAEVLAGLQSEDLDVGIIGAAIRLPTNLKTTHSFEDRFVIIAPPQLKLPKNYEKLAFKKLMESLSDQRWLLIHHRANTRKLIDDWFQQQGVSINPIMEMDNFDLIVNMVGLGMGVSVVPYRTLPIYPSRRVIQKIPITPVFSRRIAVVVRNRKITKPVTQDFVDNLLF